MDKPLIKEKNLILDFAKIFLRPFSLAMLLLAFDALYIFLYEEFFIYHLPVSSGVLWSVFLSATALLIWIFVDFICSFSKDCVLSRLVLFLLATGIYAIAFFFNAEFAMSSPNSLEDILGKDITIPKGMRIEKVLKNNHYSKKYTDSKYEELITSWAKSAKNKNEPIIQKVTFPELTDKNKRLLLRHFASSAQWYVTEGGGNKILITRRNQYLNSAVSFHGKDYSQSGELDIATEGNTDFDLTADWAFDKIQKNLPLKEYKSIYKSALRIGSNNFGFVVKEESESQSRPFTNTVLQQLSREFEEVIHCPETKIRGFCSSAMPSISISKGPSELKLYQNGASTYGVTGYLNPGEPGRIYLKAFEPTSHRALTLTSSTEHIGWSDNPDEKFMFLIEGVSVEEGGSKYKFPVRIEVWFRSDNEKNIDRLLLSKIYMINGKDWWFDD